MIRLFQRDKLIKTFKGHTQAVRALAKLDKSAVAESAKTGSLVAVTMGESATVHPDLLLLLGRVCRYVT